MTIASVIKVGAEPTAAHRGPPLAWTVAGTVEATAAASEEPNGGDAGKPAPVAHATWLEASNPTWLLWFVL